MTAHRKRALANDRVRIADSVGETVPCGIRASKHRLDRKGDKTRLCLLILVFFLWSVPFGTLLRSVWSVSWFIYLFKTKGQNRPLTCPSNTVIKTRYKKNQTDQHRKQRI